MRVPSTNEQENSEAQKIIVKGNHNDLEASRDFAAGKIIIGRKQISDSGLQNAGELLKRVPAVTIGKDGRISLLGLPGYTQVLLNGQVPVGKSPLEVDLSEVERIEIVKSTTAETGPFGIAGSINVISKKVDRKKSQQASFGVQDAAGAYGVNGAWSINEGSIDRPWQWNLSVTASRMRSINPIVFTQSEIDNGQKVRNQLKGAGRDESITDLATISSGFVYRINEENVLSFNPALGQFKMDTQNQEERRYWTGQRWAVSRRSVGVMHGFDLPLSWTSDVGDDGVVDVDVKLSRNQFLTKTNNANVIDVLPKDMRRFERQDDTNSYHFKVNYKQSVEGGHEFTTGLNWSKSAGNTSSHYWLNGRPDLSLATFGEVNRLNTDTWRIFLQDAWRVNKTTALNVGLSGEDSVSTIQEGTLASQARYRVWSPSFHLSRKIASDLKRQFRFSIARSFKAPDPNNLLVRPSINALAPCSSALICQPNSLDTFDSAGNPSLHAERALSLNLSYEHGLSENSQISFETYLRQIEQKFGREISLETVPWSNLPRYVNRPVNLGDAQIVGASIDWQLALRDVWKTSPKIEVRGSVGHAHSVVSNLPAPYNHLEGQTPWRAKLGMTYDVTGIPLKINLDGNWLPGDWIRNNLVQKTYESRHASYSANATWTASKTMKWTMSLNNLFAPPKYSVKEYQAGKNFIQRQSEKTNYTQIGVRLELKL